MFRLVDNLNASLVNRSEGEERLAAITAIHNELTTIHSNNRTFLEQAQMDLSSGTAAGSVLERFRERAGCTAIRGNSSFDACSRELVLQFRELGEIRKDERPRPLIIIVLGYVVRLKEYLDDSHRGCSYVETPGDNIIEGIEIGLEGGLSEHDVVKTFQMWLRHTLMELEKVYGSLDHKYSQIRSRSL